MLGSELGSRGVVDFVGDGLEVALQVAVDGGPLG